MLALLVGMAIMLTMMGVGARAWSQIMRDDRERELIFRGGQIADAIQRYQQKHGNAAPPSLESLVEGKFLRKLYADPMTESGEWRLVHQGEAIAPIRAPGSSPSPSPTASPRATPRFLGATGQGSSVGPIVGVASLSTKKSLRLLNGRDRYDLWLFLAGQPRVVGKQQLAATPVQGSASAPATPLRQSTPGRQ